MMESESPRKNLWKNLKTQRTKHSGIEQTNNSPVISYTKESNHNSEPLRPFLLEKHFIINRDKSRLQDQFSNVEKEVELGVQGRGVEMSKGNTLGFATVPPLGPIESHTKNHGKIRRFSIGEESIVQEIVDFKNQHNLQIGDFQQDQQPMIMSLGSQSNPAIRMLKLSRVKDDIEKLQSTRVEIVNFMKEQARGYNQLFEKSVHDLLAYVLQFYYEKLEAQKQEQEANEKEKNNFLSKNRRSIGQEDTPRFAKPLNSQKTEQSEKQIREKELQYEQQIHRLEEELFKCKLQNQTLQYSLKTAKQQNQDLNEQIFDMDQKNAQFQLEVSKRVEEVVAQKGGEGYRVTDQAQNDRKYYLDQILSLEKQIQILEKNSYNQSYNQELNQIREELEKKDEYLTYRETQIIEKEKAMNELQVELNSQKLDLEKKIKNLQQKELELRSFQVKLEQRDMEISIKEKQIAVKEVQVQKESLVFDKSHLVHRPKASGEQFEYNLDLKLKNLSSYKTADGGRARNQRQWQHNTSYALTQGNRNWQFSALSQKNDVKRKINEYTTKQRKSNSKQKEKSREKPLYGINKSYISTSRPGITTKTQNNQSYSHSISNTKQMDRNRLEDLGTKLQNLRNQIRKQIRDTQ